MSIGSPYRGDLNVAEHSTSVMTGNVTLQLEDADVMVMNTDGTARNVTLPALAKGAQVTIINTSSGAVNITVLNPGVTVVNGVVGQNEIGVFYCDGTTWNHMTGVA